MISCTAVLHRLYSPLSFFIRIPDGGPVDFSLDRELFPIDKSRSLASVTVLVVVLIDDGNAVVIGIPINWPPSAMEIENRNKSINYFAN